MRTDWDYETSDSLESRLQPLAPCRTRSVIARSGQRAVGDGGELANSIIAVEPAVGSFVRNKQFHVSVVVLINPHDRVCDFRERAVAIVAIELIGVVIATHENVQATVVIEIDPGGAFTVAGGAASPVADSAFERLWAEEWEEHVRQSALARVKRQV